MSTRGCFRRMTRSAAVSVVPLRVGGGTRLKIYGARAARTPVVSTTIGAEGLGINPPHDIRIADTPETFAEKLLGVAERPNRAQENGACRMRSGRVNLLLGARHRGP